MKRNFARLYLLIFVVLSVLSACGVPDPPMLEAEQSQGTAEPLDTISKAEDALTYLDDNYNMKNGFTTTLPLVVMREDTGVDFFLEADTMSKVSMRKPSDLRATATDLNSAGPSQRIKKDYLLQISEDSLPKISDALWDSPVYDQWYLLGNMFDKSLMRSYLALSLANELDISDYFAHYCEVFAEKDGNFQYQGVYLIAAPIKGANNHFQRGSHGDSSSTPLNTYATQQDILVEGLYVPTLYNLNSEDLKQMKETISAGETSIFSGNYNEFSKYTRYVDSQRMYDYFIIYELFGNYGGAHMSRYNYDPDKKRFWPSAIADFEFSADNDAVEAFDLFDIQLMETPYYTALVKNTNFIKDLLSRYRSLCEDLLKSSKIEALIDETALLLGEAQMRDWSRWEEVYTGKQTTWLAAQKPDEAILENNEAFIPIDRNTYAFEHEVNKLKFTLREHGEYMFSGISLLYDQEDMMGDDAPYVKNTWMAIVSIFLVALSVTIVRRRTR